MRSFSDRLILEKKDFKLKEQPGKSVNKNKMKSKYVYYYFIILKVEANRGLGASNNCIFFSWNDFISVTHSRISRLMDSRRTWWRPSNSITAQFWKLLATLMTTAGQALGTTRNYLAVFLQSDWSWTRLSNVWDILSFFPAKEVPTVLQEKSVEDAMCQILR